MQWTEVRFRLAAAREEALSTALDMAGITAYALASRDDGDLDLLLYGQDGHVDRDALTVLAELGLQPEAATDWDEAELYALSHPGAPVRIADRAWIIPPHCQRAEQPMIAADDYCVVIPPGPAFGDGRHPTTRMCAEFLMQHDYRGLRVLDVGCGSGALGILAAQRGAERVDFCDIDPDSVRLTQDACALNGITPGCVVESDLLESVPDTTYDVIIANIYADLVANLLLDERLPKLLPQGQIIVSGISHKKRELVDEVLDDAGCRLIADKHEAWWDGLLLERSRQ